MALDESALREIDSSIARAGDGDPVRRWAHPSAVFVLPGFVLDREGFASALDLAEPWDRVEVEPHGVVPLGGDTAAVVSRFTGLRGDRVYRADTVSTYAETVEGPRLMTHQHTLEWHPEDGDETDR